MGCVELARLQSDVEFVAKERTVGSEHWARVQDECAARFEQLGFAVERHAYGTGVNVIGVKAGVERPEERVLLSAHYDHIPECLGADDNASAVAGVFEAARVLAPARFSRTLVVACWDEEETGLIGSRAYAERARAAYERIVVSYVFEGIAHRSLEPNTQSIPAGMDLVFPTQVAQVEANKSRADFVLLVWDDLSSPQGEKLVDMMGAAELPAISAELTATQKKSQIFVDLRRSDHASFWDVDFPAMYIGDTGPFRSNRYHCEGAPDEPSALDYDFATRIVRATIAAIAAELELR
jgi:hypothetical protein